MKFRARDINTGKIIKNVFLSDSGKTYRKNLFDMQELKNIRIEKFLFKDSLGKSVYEHDILESLCWQYLAGFDIDMGAVLISSDGNKIKANQIKSDFRLKAQDDS